MRPPRLSTALLRLEDVVLFVVSILLPVLAARGASGGGGSADGGGAADPLAGLVALVAILGVIACMLTRGPDEPPPLADREMTLQGWARFPLAAGVGIVAIETLPDIGLPDGPFAFLAFASMIVGAIAFPKLPVVPVNARRALVLPMTLVAAGAFSQIVGSTAGDMLAGFVNGTAPPEVTALWPLIVGAIAALYVMLVVAPRAIADPGASGVAWAVRFVLLLVSLGAGSLLGSVM